MRLDILDYSVYGNVIDAESDACIAAAVEALGVAARVRPIAPGASFADCAPWVWLRYDLRSREDLRWICAAAGELVRSGRAVFPSAAAILRAEDKRETCAALRAAGVPTPECRPVAGLAACGRRAVVKPRVGWGGMGMLRVDDTGAFRAPEGFIPEDYVCQAFIPHDRTWTVAGTSEGAIAVLEKWRRAEDFRTDGEFNREVRLVAPFGNVAAIARAALAAVDLAAGTVDCIAVAGGLAVLEVNSSPCFVYPRIAGSDLAAPMARRVYAWMGSCGS